MTIGTGTTLIELVNVMIGENILMILIVSLDAKYVDCVVGCLYLVHVVQGFFSTAILPNQ